MRCDRCGARAAIWVECYKGCSHPQCGPCAKVTLQEVEEEKAYEPS